MKRGFIFIIACLSFLFLFRESGAQTAGPQFLITWQAASYAPADFAGKILPTANSPITASFELINNNRLVDLSGQTIYWYANDAFIAGGAGVQRVSFLAPKVAGGSIDLRVQLPDYRGGTLLKTVEIPVARPEAVILSPFPNGQFANTKIQLKALLYFFNVKSPDELTTSWKVNGEAPQNSDHPETLNLTLRPDAPSGMPVAVSIAVQNPINIFEGAVKNLNLVFVK